MYPHKLKIRTSLSFRMDASSFHRFPFLTLSVRWGSTPGPTMIVLLVSARCVSATISRDAWPCVCPSSSLVCRMGVSFRFCVMFSSSASLAFSLVRPHACLSVEIVIPVSSFGAFPAFCSGCSDVVPAWGNSLFVMFSGCWSFHVGGSPRFRAFSLNGEVPIGSFASGSAVGACLVVCVPDCRISRPPSFCFPLRHGPGFRLGLFVMRIGKANSRIAALQSHQGLGLSVSRVFCHFPIVNSSCSFCIFACRFQFVLFFSEFTFD